MEKRLKLAVLTDVHHGPDHETKIGRHALEMMSALIDRINSGEFDRVIEMGDRVSNVDPDTDRTHLQQVADLFMRLGPPRHHLLGNHDVVHLSREENAHLLETDMNSAYVDTDFIRLVFWQPEVRIIRNVGLPVLTEDLNWLEAALSSAPGQAIVFTHVPISGHTQRSNYYFENNFEHATYPGYEKILDRVVRRHAAAAWVSGHVHWNSYINISGIPMFTIQSMTESFTTGSQPSGAWAEIEITPTHIHCRVNGRDPLTVRAPLIDRSYTPWLPPMGPFHKIDAAEQKP